VKENPEKEGNKKKRLCMSTSVGGSAWKAVVTHASPKERHARTSVGRMGLCFVTYLLLYKK
jgi:hypothetical protein